VSRARIRPFVEDDIPAVAALRLRAFRVSRRRNLDALAAYFKLVFFDNPWRDESLPSLVYESDGRVGGFVGVIPRRMTLRGQRLRVVVSTQFMVDASVRGLAGIELVRRLFAGPQDLTLADAAPDAARRIWTGLRGEVAAAYSLFWVRSLRPGRFAMLELGDRLVTRAARWMLRPLVTVSDTVLGRLRRESGPQRLTAPVDCHVEPLDAATLAREAPLLLRDIALHPEYDERAYGWLLDRAREGERSGRLRCSIVRDAAGRALGWFVYYEERGGIYEERGGIARVIQLAAAPHDAVPVIKTLWREARRSGAIAVRGQMIPPLLTPLSLTGCSFRRRGPWVLAQSRRADVLHAIARGDAWISALDGERWLTF
jgi:hypothetical protein